MFLIFSALLIISAILCEPSSFNKWDLNALKAKTAPFKKHWRAARRQAAEMMNNGSSGPRILFPDTP